MKGVLVLREEGIVKVAQKKLTTITDKVLSTTQQQKPIIMYSTSMSYCFIFILAISLWQPNQLIQGSSDKYQLHEYIYQGDNKKESAKYRVLIFLPNIHVHYPPWQPTLLIKGRHIYSIQARYYREM
jgi:hypothetical protein